MNRKERSEIASSIASIAPIALVALVFARSPEPALHGGEPTCLASISPGFDQVIERPLEEGSFDDEYSVDGKDAFVVGASTGMVVPDMIANSERSR